jgi:glyoxylase-like metal-dependent hydrolase (beta-lactamase superfamily II)
MKMLKVMTLTLGPMPNNVYILGDSESSDAVVIDPSFESGVVLSRLTREGWTVRQVWLTHGHFDHIAGAKDIADAYDPPLPIGLHAEDLDWYSKAGGANQFGLSIPQPAKPSIFFEHGQKLSLRTDGEPVVTVLHAPGHSPGHVMFYCPALGVLFCGDVIFNGGIGRTDLPGGSMKLLMDSIRQQVLTLPDETRLLPGHGPESTVGMERMYNPFL